MLSIIKTFFKYKLSTIFTTYGICQHIFSLDIFILFSEALLLITWVFHTSAGNNLSGVAVQFAT